MGVDRRDTARIATTLAFAVVGNSFTEWVGRRTRHVDDCVDCLPDCRAVAFSITAAMRITVT